MSRLRHHQNMLHTFCMLIFKILIHTAVKNYISLVRISELTTPSISLVNAKFHRLVLVTYDLTVYKCLSMSHPAEKLHLQRLYNRCDTDKKKRVYTIRLH